MPGGSRCHVPSADVCRQPGKERTSHGLHLEVIWKSNWRIQRSTRCGSALSPRITPYRYHFELTSDDRTEYVCAFSRMGEGTGVHSGTFFELEGEQSWHATACFRCCPSSGLDVGEIVTNR